MPNTLQVLRPAAAVPSFAAFSSLHVAYLPARIARTRRLDQIDTSALIDRMAALRAEAVSVADELAAASAAQAALRALTDTIDHNAHLITGRADYFASRPF